MSLPKPPQPGRPYTRDVHHSPETVEHEGRIAGLSTVLTGEMSYRNDHLTRPAFISLAILTFITFVGNFTQLQLSAALPSLVDDFGISVTLGQWMTSIFQLTMGVMVPLTAYLTRRFSTRQIVIASMVVFTVGSVLAWLSPTFPLALFGRFLEAVGTGVMWPVLQITVFSIFPLDRRGMAMGIVGMAMAVAPAIGPTLGGLQTDMNGWRAIFLTLTVIGCISILLAVFGLHNFGESDKTAHADFFSVGLSIIGFGGLMFGFTNIQAYPLAAPVVWLPMIVGLAGIVWFVLRQFRNERRFKTGKTSRPALLDLSVLRNAHFSVGTIIASLSFFAFQLARRAHPALHPELPRLHSHHKRSCYAPRRNRPGHCPVLWRPRTRQVRGTPCRHGRHHPAVPWHDDDEHDRHGHLDLVHLDLPVHPADRHGLCHDAGHHVVAQLP